MIGHNLLKARGTFAKVVPVPSRGVYQFVIEVDDGQANAALDALGGLPAGGDARWVSIALLDAEKPQAPSRKEPRRWDEMPASQQAGILCAERQFQQWIKFAHADVWNRLAPPPPGEPFSDEEAAASIVRYVCGVASRSYLDKQDDARAKWDALVSRYRRETGREAEPR